MTDFANLVTRKHGEIVESDAYVMTSNGTLHLQAEPCERNTGVGSQAPSRSLGQAEAELALESGWGSACPCLLRELAGAQQRFRGLEADFRGAERQIAKLEYALAEQRTATQAAARLASSARDQLAEDRRDDQLAALRAEVAFQRGRAEAFRSLARK